MPAQHILSAAPETVHWGYFDAGPAPRLSVDSGDTVTLHCVSGGPLGVGARMTGTWRSQSSMPGGPALA